MSERLRRFLWGAGVLWFLSWFNLYLEIDRCYVYWARSIGGLTPKLVARR